jgi:hypothetical protein
VRTRVDGKSTTSFGDDTKKSTSGKIFRLQYHYPAFIETDFTNKQTNKQTNNKQTNKQTNNKQTDE